MEPQPPRQADDLVKQSHGNGEDPAGAQNAGKFLGRQYRLCRNIEGSGGALVDHTPVGIRHVISVHRRGCVNTVDAASDRNVEVRWGDAIGVGYPVAVRVMTESGIPGLLNKMTKVFSDLKINIDAAICAEAPDGRAENVFRFRAKHLDELNDVSRKLESLRGVHSVARVRE